MFWNIIIHQVKEMARKRRTFETFLICDRESENENADKFMFEFQFCPQWQLHYYISNYLIILLLSCNNFHANIHWYTIFFPASVMLENVSYSM